MADETNYNDPTGLEKIDYDQDQVSPEVKKHTKNVRHKMYGRHVRESIARAIEVIDLIAFKALNISKKTEKRQNHIENQFDDVVANVTVDSEVILARRPEGAEKPFDTLGRRLDSIDDKFKKLKEMQNEYNICFLSEEGLLEHNTAEENDLVFDKVLKKYGNNYTYVLPHWDIYINKTIKIIGKQIHFFSFSRTQIIANDFMEEMIGFEVENDVEINQIIKIEYVMLSGKNKAKKGINLTTANGDYSAYVNLKEVYAFECLEYGIYGQSDSWVIKLSDCYTSFNGLDGIFFGTSGHGKTGQTNAYFCDNITSIRNGRDGVSLSGISHFLSNPNIEKNGRHGLVVSDDNSKTSKIKTTNATTIIGGYIEGNYENEIYIESSGPGRINGLSIRDVYLNHLNKNTSVIKCVGPVDSIDNLIIDSNTYAGNYLSIIDGGNALTSRCNLGFVLNPDNFINISGAKMLAGTWDQLYISSNNWSNLRVSNDQWASNLLSISTPITTLGIDGFLRNKVIRRISIPYKSNINEGIAMLYFRIIDNKTGNLIQGTGEEIYLKGNGMIDVNVSNLIGLRRLKTNESAYIRLDITNKGSGTEFSLFNATLETSF